MKTELDDSTVAWVLANQVELAAYNKLINQMRADFMVVALNKGDTEYEKGIVYALGKVLRLPELIIKSVDDTSDTSTETEDTRGQ